MNSAIKYLTAISLVALASVIHHVDARPSKVGGNMTTTVSEMNPLFRLPPPVAESRVHVLTRETTDSCRRQGGLCVLTDECPAGSRSQLEGLCGASDKACCHSLPTTITDCRERGGFCGTAAACGRAPREPLGSCPKDEFCCLHVI